MVNYDLETACREGLSDRKLISMIQQRVLLLNSDIDEGEQGFLTNYAYQDLKYYLLYKFGLFNLEDKEASFELCKRVLSNEADVINLVDEWFSWWIVKWRQRVKLVFSEMEQEEASEADVMGIDSLMKRVPKRVLERLRREVILELIRQGEVCSLDLISDFIIRMVVNDLINEYGVEGTLRLFATNLTEVRLRVLSKIMEIRRSNQPLVILKVRINQSWPYQGLQSE
nr:MAG: hypothetical protein TU36_00820 [Vulcanisaeta sp. AZ3]